MRRHDLTQLPAHTEYSVLQIIGEVGTDLTKWPTEKHFTAWTGPRPGQPRKRQAQGLASSAAAIAPGGCSASWHVLARSKDIALGGFYRRMAARRGGLIANMALARKLAAWFWRVMVKGNDYVEQGLAHYEAQVLQTKQRALKRLAKDNSGNNSCPSSRPPVPVSHNASAFTEINDLPHWFMEGSGLIPTIGIAAKPHGGRLSARWRGWTSPARE